MKRIIFIILSLLLYVSIFAQQAYKSYFGEEYTKWYICYPGHEWGGIYHVFLSCCNRTQDIDGVTYQCLFMLGDDTISSVPENTVCDAYLREETSTGQLFLRGAGLETEVIVSDMSLQVGDSIRLYNESLWYYNEHWENIIVTDENIPYAIVDSVYYLNDLKHIRTSAVFRNYNLGNKDTLKFIETVGSNISPMLDHSWFNNSRWGEVPISTCYETENKLFHFFDNYACFKDYVGIKNLKAHSEVREKIKNGLLNLFFDQTFSGQINLLDYTGKLLYQTTLSKATGLIVNIGKFPKGVYILQIRNKNNEVLNKKIIIT